LSSGSETHIFVARLFPLLIPYYIYLYLLLSYFSCAVIHICEVYLIVFVACSPILCVLYVTGYS
jgi:hypothetical protein